MRYLITTLIIAFFLGSIFYINHEPDASPTHEPDASPTKESSTDRRSDTINATSAIGPWCFDEEKIKPGQPKPYCGDLPSLANVNFREARLDVVWSKFKYPWAMEFIDQSRVIVSEFRGKLKIFDLVTTQITELSGLPEISSGKGQSGLLDVALHPNFRANSLVYFSYSVENDEGSRALAVARAQIDGNQLRAVEQLIVAEPFNKSASNFGGALEFDNKNYLYVATGDRSVNKQAQNPQFLTGKVLRLRDDGTIPDDNPFINNSDYHPAIYAIGVRNPQGLVFDDVTGLMYETEHGPMGGDEVNIIKAGKNYGWPNFTYGMNYTYKKIGKKLTSEASIESPLFYYLPSIATSPVEVYRGKMFEDWYGHILVGGLRANFISKLDQHNGAIISEYGILGELKGRIRDIKTSPDGAIFILLQDGRLVKLWRVLSDGSLAQKAKTEISEGQRIFESTCASCHLSQKPRYGVASHWESRITKGKENLYKNAIDGVGNMPAMGLCEDCTEQQIKKAVDYILKSLADS